MGDKTLADIAAATQGVYERQGPRFDAERPKHLMERAWLERFSALIPPSGKVLDAGCGAGEPIAKHLIEQGFQLTGVDYSSSMIDLVQSRFPNHSWLQGDMTTLSLKTAFHGIIGWHSFFHLNQDQQRKTLVKFAQHLAPGGALLLTVGHEAGEVLGHVGGEQVYHASLSKEEYTQILANCSVNVREFVIEDPECGGATVLFAQKTA